MTELATPPDLLEKLEKWEQDDDNHWSKWRKMARESYAFVSSDQWTKDERSQAEGAGRLVTTINRIGPMINAVAGAEIVDRQQVQYVPRTTGDAAVNEILTMGAEWIRDQSMADREESDAFRDVLICGLGYTETLMSYDDEPEGKIIVQRIDPLEVLPDAGARGHNLRDKRRIRRKRKIGKDEFKALYPEATVVDDNYASSSGASGRPARKAYKADNEVSDDECADDEVVICEWQWFEFESAYAVPDPEGKVVQVTTEQYNEGLKLGAFPKGVKQRRKVYYRAVKCGGQILEYERLPDNEFTIKCLTGERDQNKGIWYGIVEAMKDPQRFANLFFSMLHHIIRTNAKGGILAEADAFVDPKKAQESWARSDAVTWVKPGKLGSIKPKDAPAIPAQITQLLQYAVAGIKDASGINEELLGLVGREQPGVLEHQRKQAAYAILAGYYDSLHFYRKEQGNLLLKYMQRYLAPNGYLVRIVGEDGNQQYMPLIQYPDTMKFDVIVSDAPQGPNQKERVWALISNMQSILANAGPEVWAELIEYSPFPDKVNKKLKEVFVAHSQPDPAEQQAQQQAMQVEQAAQMADVAMKQAKAGLDGANMQKIQTETALMMQVPAGFLAVAR